MADGLELKRIVDLVAQTDIDEGVYTIIDSVSGAVKKYPLGSFICSIAPIFSTSVSYTAGKYCNYNGQLYQFDEDHAAGGWIGTDATAVTLSDILSEIGEDVNDLLVRVSTIEEAEGLHKYGVSGIGQSASALTRLWDAVGMTAQVGTDGDNSNVINNFDEVTPFNRRKCVGRWYKIDGKAVFRVNAYLGDEDYAEDGSMGDYVAVECPRAFYYLKDGVLGISAHQFPGWRPFDIFCKQHNPDDTIPFVYLPAYALALDANGHAVSLPGYDNCQGNYKNLVDAARTYQNGELGNLSILQPMAVNFYEWALYTVEFATQNCQNIMQGCAGLRHDNNDRVTFKDSTHLLTNNYYASRVVGEYISVVETSKDINDTSYLATHKITEVVRCDENGDANPSGTHQLLTVEDLGKTYYTYDTVTEYKLCARPYRTGSCNSVSTPSGSPVSNSDSYHPMKYRHRENVFANQYKTIMDMFNKRVGTGDDDYYLEWYYLPEPQKYEPSSTSKPDATDLAGNDFVLLDVQTDHADYVNGWIKSKKYSDEFPDLWIPDKTTGGSASTYYCDYAYLVLSYVVRSVRLGGAWYAGSYDGFSNASASYAPSYGIAAYGGDLCFVQDGGEL